MGLQYNVQVLREDGTVEGFHGDYPRREYGSLAIVTGMTWDRLSQDGWGQLVSREMAADFLYLVGNVQGHYALKGLEAGLVRITIA